MSRVEVSGFQSSLSGKLTSWPVSDLQIGWGDLLWAAITVGRRDHYDVFRHGYASEMEVIYRVALLRANLEERSVSVLLTRLFRTTAFESLDSSEKGAVTYFIGLALSKLIAEREGVNWLMHLDVYGLPRGGRPAVIPVTLFSGRKRPDLFGESDSGDWMIMESKGRTQGVSHALRIDAKQQTRRVRDINGQLPRWRWATIAKFVGPRLALEVIDPLNPLPRAPRIQIPLDLFVVDYYRLVVRLLTESGDGLSTLEIGGHQYSMRRIDRVDIEVGMRADLLDMLRGSEPAQLMDSAADGSRSVHDKLRALLADAVQVRADQTRVGRDGIAVRLGKQWSSAGVGR